MEIKLTTTKISIATTLFLGFFVIAMSTSCKKEDPTRVTVTVIDTLGKKVSGAFVRVYAKPTDTTRNAALVRFDEVKRTGGSGQASFDYTDFTKPGQAGFAVLDIHGYVINPDDVNDTLAQGIGQVRVEEEKNNTETLRIQ